MTQKALEKKVDVLTRNFNEVVGEKAEHRRTFKPYHVLDGRISYI
jgi:hypothetical protein